VRAAGRLSGGDDSPVGNGGGGEVLEHWGANRGVRRSQKEKEMVTRRNSLREEKSGSSSKSIEEPVIPTTGHGQEDKRGPRWVVRGPWRGEWEVRGKNSTKGVPAAF
jgi:hypothetical protein